MTLINVEKVVELRKQRGWDQKDLAMAANITKPVISRLERKLQADFKLSVIISIADALGVTVDELLVRSYPSREKQMIPELRAEILRLADQAEDAQRHGAELVRWYLSLLER